MDYHDNVWGKPEHNDRVLFEMLSLEAMQAGISWYTVLVKQQNFRLAFDNWDVKKIADYGEPELKQLLKDKGIIRNRLKIEAIVHNARAFMKVQSEFGSFERYIWRFVNHKPIVNNWENLSDIPVKTEVSDTMSKDLKERGFKFVGSTICYAFMQACGLVNDHLVSCWTRHI